jgi:Zn-dependent M28 family amino/carboxypeptidase
MAYFFILLSFWSLSSLAHQDFDWREDYQAYLSVEYENPLIFKQFIPKDSNISQVDMEYFQEKLMAFTATSDRRSLENLDLARQFLKKEYEALGFSVEFHTFGGGINFIAEKKGEINSQKVLILSSHIDTVRCPGANDNGTGTIGVLTVAKALSTKKLNATIRILGFDQEEIGLRGSDAYVATLKDKKSIIGNINFEMMGVNARQDGGFHVIDCQRADSQHLSRAIKNAIITYALPLTVVKACTDRSDHASFWRHQIPAIVISENFFGGDADPCYHAKCDKVDDRLNYNYMGNILTATLDAVQNLLQ